MKISERHFFDDGRMIHRQTWDADPLLLRARQIRDGKPVLGVPEGEHVATISRFQLEQWCAEDGVDLSDNKAVDEMLAKRLNSPDFVNLRTNGGEIRPQGFKWV